MPKYRVSLTETVEYVAEIEAADEQEALEEACVLAGDYGDHFYTTHGESVLEAELISPK